ncbi:hypothetical protein ACFQZ4_52435 [Catellatospora coxensis]
MLSFTTALTAAAGQGGTRAVEYARRHNLPPAARRSETDERRPVSLSPVTIRSAQGVRRLTPPRPTVRRPRRGRPRPVRRSSGCRRATPPTRRWPWSPPRGR